MKRWKLTPLTDQPAGLTGPKGVIIHEGDEDSVSRRINDLHAATGTPYEVAEYDEEAERADQEREQDEMRDEQKAADEA